MKLFGCGLALACIVSASTQPRNFIIIPTDDQRHEVRRSA